MCGPVISIKEKIEKSDYVALVTIQDIISMKTHAFYKTIITEEILFKGKSSSEMITYGSNRLVDSTYFTNCDIPLRKGEQWVIFGHYKNGKLEIEDCDGSFNYRTSSGYRDIMYGYRIRLLNQVSEYFHKPIIDFNKKNGELRVNYPNGNTEMIAHFKNGVKHGFIKYFYPNGSLITQEKYVKGKLDGTRITYTTEGTITRTEHFSNGIQVDSANDYTFNTDSGRTFLYNTSFYNKKGEIISHKYFIVPYNFEGMPAFMKDSSVYMYNEWYTDTLKNEITHIYYHPNGRIKTRYILNAKTRDYIGDEIDMDSLGRVTKILRPVKGKRNQMIYIDTVAWPNYKNWK
jgi:antitoxin component YwqK of YwqJK toxin-antitoxin module